jgi:hypothetical protein
MLVATIVVLTVMVVPGVGARHSVGATAGVSTGVWVPTGRMTTTHQGATATLLPNIVVNGSFEEPVVGSGNAILPSIPGWNLAYGQDFEIWNHLNGWLPYDGQQMVELDVYASTGIYQDLPTAANEQYVLQFSFSPRPGTPQTYNVLGVKWGGTQVGILSADGTGLNQTSWTTYSYTLTATTSTTRLEFDDLGNGNSEGTLLDAVSVVVQPTANLAVSPTSGFLGQTITLTGTGYGPNETVTIRADGISAPPIYVATTDATGAFVITRHVLQGTYGSHTLIAVGQSSHHLGVTTFSITPLLAITPRSGSGGTSIAVSGFGFGANEQVNLYWYNPQQWVGSASTSSLGSFYGSATVHFTIPAGTPAGQNVVSAVGQTSHALRTVVVNVQ